MASITSHPLPFPPFGSGEDVDLCLAGRAMRVRATTGEEFRPIRPDGFTSAPRRVARTDAVGDLPSPARAAPLKADVPHGTRTRAIRRPD